MELNYKLAKDIILKDGAIPLTWWTNTINFGDLLSPYLVEKLTSTPVKLVPLIPGFQRGYFKKHLMQKRFSYFAIGSIISRVTHSSIVWGSGAFGTETYVSVDRKAKYLAVRGPLTRNLLRINRVKNVPEVYGDPALLMPLIFNPKVEKKYKIGVILRWQEKEWNDAEYGPGIKKIYLGTDDIEGTLTDILSCEKILSSSLHGVILADAYKIPSAWLKSDSPKGFEFKYYDYFISVNKLQKSQEYNFTGGKVTCEDIESQIAFDDRIIEFDAEALLNACPFIEKNT